MSKNNLPATNQKTGADSDNQKNQYITVYVGGQLFGISVLLVHDVLGAQDISKIPQSQDEVCGSLNLRGRIVTAIELSRCLGISSNETSEKMSVVVEFGEELYSLVIDSVGEVLSLDADKLESNPSTLDAQLQNVSKGIYRLDGELLVILSVRSLFEKLLKAAA